MECDNSSKWIDMDSEVSRRSSEAADESFFEGWRLFDEVKRDTMTDDRQKTWNLIKKV